MKLQDAQRTLAPLLSPLSVDAFLDRTLTGEACRIAPAASGARTGLLGEHPADLLAGAVRLAPDLTFHSANALGPPPSLEGVADAADFRARIEAFHARNYSVRFPNLRPLSPELDGICRALEALLHQPVTASAFWSVSGMRAPVHYDDHDLIVIQLRGTKRWYVSSGPSARFNTWKGISGNPPDLGEHEVLDLVPGDLVYLPRGTFHTVDSDAESIHLALGFSPLTLRDVLIAAADHLSDLEPALRATVGGRIAYQLRDGRTDMLAPMVERGAAQLLDACRAPGFLAAALQRRSSRAISALDPLPAPNPPPAIGLDTVLVRHERAVSHLSANADKIDVSYPGGHLYIHRGVQEAVVHIVDAPPFRVRDLPGDIDDDVRLALAARFVAIGFLQVA